MYRPGDRKEGNTLKKRSIIGLVLASFAIILVGCSNSKQTKESQSEVQTATSSKKEESKMIYKETKGKNVTYYTMSPDSVFGATATLIEKDGKGLLVDTQFSKTDANKIVQVAKENKIDIEKIYISYSDPDYYFGTQQIKKTFPNVKVIATVSTIERIKNTYESKLSVWSDTLKDGAPDKIVIPEEVGSSIQLGDTTFTIFGSDPAKQTLYSEEDQLLLGGILVSTDGHLFMADTKTVENQEQWIKDLNELAALEPKTVIPGHFGEGNDFSEKNIEFTSHYIEKFIDVEKESKNSEEVIEKMKKAYPNLPEGSLEMSAKVVTGEQPWE